MSDELYIFDDIRTVLEQQLQRLTQLELGILFWLAHNRIAVSMRTLLDRLLYLGSKEDILSAAQSLRRRMMIVQTPNGIMLSNVVTEYVTKRYMKPFCEGFGDLTKVSV